MKLGVLALAMIPSLVCGPTLAQEAPVSEVLESIPLTEAAPEADPAVASTPQPLADIVAETAPIAPTDAVVAPVPAPEPASKSVAESAPAPALLPEALPLADPLPAATAAPAPSMVASAPEVSDRSTEVVSLRARFDELKAQHAEILAGAAPASAETEARIAEAEARNEANEAAVAMAQWKAQNLKILGDSMANLDRGPLPDGVPPGTVPDIALAVLEAQATLYSRPETNAQTVIRTLAVPTTMLRVAEVGAYTLVWSSQDKFAFVLSQFRKVYE